MMRCACGRSFVPDEELYHAHVQTAEHVRYSRRMEAERESARAGGDLLDIPMLYQCSCGTIHFADSALGRRHRALGMVVINGKPVPVGK